MLLSLVSSVLSQPAMLSVGFATVALIIGLSYYVLFAVESESEDDES
ncbi:hypothetical protein ACEU6E_04485 [Halorutilales archaeon Cl-col2-1]